MKQSSLYIPENTGKIGKKVCRDVIDMVKIWKNTGKFGKILKVRFLPEFYHPTFAMQSENFTIFPILPRKVHTHNKSISDLTATVRPEVKP